MVSSGLRRLVSHRGLAAATLTMSLVVAAGGQLELSFGSLSAGDATCDQYAPGGCTGRISIAKLTNPPGLGGDFSFSGAVSGTISQGEELETSELPPGTYVVAEEAAPGFVVSAIECNDGESATPSAGDRAAGTVTVRLDPSENVTCEFTNTPADIAATLIIEVRTDPPGLPGEFRFTGAVAGTIAHGEQLVARNLGPGLYEVTQDDHPDFVLRDVVCDDGASENPSVGDLEFGASIVLDPAETVTCVFTSIPANSPGTLVVKKETIPAGAPGEFTFSGAASGSIGDGEQFVADLAPGTHTVTEEDPGPDFVLTGIFCDDGVERPNTGDRAARTATVKIEPAKTVTCTFTNTSTSLPGSIMVKEETLPDGAAGSFTFTGAVSGTLADGDFASVNGLPAGTYTVTETDPGPGFELLAITCDDGDSLTPSAGNVAARTATIRLDPGEGLTCTFVNQRTAIVDQQRLPTEMMSVDTAGRQGTGVGNFGDLAVSADGRFVAFETHLDEIDGMNLNIWEDVFVHDRTTGSTERVSVDGDGVELNGQSANPAISGDGRYVAFLHAPIGSDADDDEIAYVRDRVARKTEVVNVASDGTPLRIRGALSELTETLDLSADGRFVLFAAELDDIFLTKGLFVRDRVAGVTEFVPDSQGAWGRHLSGDGRFVFYVGFSEISEEEFVEEFRVFDRETGTTTIAAPYRMEQFDVSGDGRFIAFTSAENLLAEDTNFTTDVYLYDRGTSVLRFVSVHTNDFPPPEDPPGDEYGPGPGPEFLPAGDAAVSDDGRFVAFQSERPGHVVGDGNRFGGVYVRDVETGTTTKASVSNIGEHPNDRTGGWIDLSADGAIVAFFSAATNLVCRDANAEVDVFARDIFAPERPVCARIVVEKQTRPDGAPGSFSFTAFSGTFPNPPPPERTCAAEFAPFTLRTIGFQFPDFWRTIPCILSTASLGDGETLVIDDLPAGRYRVVEALADPWSLDEIECDDSDSSGDLLARTATVRLAETEIVKCTFTNEATTVLRIEKRTLPDGAAGSFGFTLTSPDDPGMETHFTLGNDGSFEFSDVVLGKTYHIVEDESTSGFRLSGIACHGLDGTEAVTNLGERSASAKFLRAGVGMSCLFTNTREAGLSATKSAVGRLTQVYDWSIRKTVAPERWDLFRGDTGTSRFSLEVAKDDGTPAAQVEGEICVTNNGTAATQNLAITDQLGGPDGIVVSSLTVDVASNPVLDPGEHACYQYAFELPPWSIVPGAQYEDRATVSLSNVASATATAIAALPLAPQLIRDTIHVDDSNGDKFVFSDDSTVTYDQTFDCADTGMHANIATIRETGADATATVDVVCHALDVTNDAFTAFTRTHEWTIAKSAEPERLTLPLLATATVRYAVQVADTSSDTSHRVAGTITVHNRAPAFATLAGVSGDIAGVVAAEVGCAVAFPHTLAPGSTLTCTYVAALPDALERTSSATATIQNFAYGPEGASAAGTTQESASALVSFAGAAVTDIDGCVDVSDDRVGRLGTACAGPSPSRFSYELTVGGFDICGRHSVENVAAFTAADTGRTARAVRGVEIEVPCPGRIIVEKETEPAGSTESFAFTPSYGPGFSLKHGESHTSAPLPPRSGYSVSESVPPGWDVTSATCDDHSPITNIDVAPGETVTCTFKNEVVLPAVGFFVIGDMNAAIGTAITFWGAQWWTLNTLSGGSAPAAFKGFAENPSRPTCGTTWSTDPGNSPPPPAGPLPSYMGVLVAGSIVQSGSVISGNTPHIVIVKTNPGYSPNPGHAGTGTVVSTVC